MVDRGDRNAGIPEELELRSIPDLYENRNSRNEAAIKRLQEIGSAVYRVVSPLYPRYIKLLPRVDELVSEGERLADPPGWDPTSGMPPPTAAFRRVLWRSLAEEFDVPYGPEFAPWVLEDAIPGKWLDSLQATGGDGEQGAEDTAALTECLREFTAPDSRPEDRGWCVVNDYDLPFALIGGSDGLILKLQECAPLECIEIGAETRIDFYTHRQSQKPPA